MKVLIAYPNLPMMIIPAVSVGLFTGICKSLNVDVELFETTAYSDDPNKGMLYKTKIGGGRAYTPKDLGMELKPTNAMMDDFLKKVEQYKPDLVLFSTVEDTFKDTVIMLEAIEHLNVPHIVGGVFPINAPEICISHPSIKAMCRYEGEYVVRDVINRMLEGKPWDDVNGLWTKERKNAPQPLCNINEVTPDYSLYHPNRFNRAIGGRIVRAINVETYRGCPYSCTFCNSPMTRTMDKDYLRRKTMDQIKMELDRYVELYDPDYWFFIDDSWAARPKREIFELCELLEKYKIPWWCNTRIENMHEDVMAAMKAGYCDRIQFGIECGNDEYRRKVLKRNVSNKTYDEKIPIINDSGIPYGLNVIIGLPHETREMVFETIDVVRRFSGYDGIGIAIFIPYHGTVLRDYAVEHGMLSKDWISADGYLLGGSALDMPKPYLQKKEIWDLSQKIKYYCFFAKSKWNIIEEDLDKAEEIYNKDFYTKFASTGAENIKHRSKSVWACETVDHMDVRNMFV